MALLVILVVGSLLMIVVMPFVAMAKAASVARSMEELTQRIAAVENQLRSLRRAAAREERAEPAHVPEPAAAAREQEQPARPAPTAELPPAVAPKPPPAAVAVPTPPPPMPAREAAPQVKRIFSPSWGAEIKPAPTIPTSKPPINWEQFMGAKLFAWIGGLALFLGVAFFVKYSFEHNLIPPEVRVAIGFLTGIGLVIGGVCMKRKETAVTAQTLCSSGVLILYAVTFACRAYYHFAFFGLVPTFLLMSLITTVAFLLSVRLNALVVAVLGIAGGFLTPVLLSTGNDAPFALFGYIALLDIGLLAVGLRQRWSVLPVLGAIGTLLTQTGWVSRFFVSEEYFTGNKVLIPMVVFAGFEALFLAAAAWHNQRTKRAETEQHAFSAAALGLGTVAMCAAFYFLSFPSLGERPGLVLSYALVVDVGLVALVFLDGALAAIEALAGFAVFALLAVWTRSYLSAEHLYAVLAFYFVFALLHVATPVVMRRLRVTTQPWWCYAAPVLALPFYFVSFPLLSDRPVLLFGCVFLVGFVLLSVAFFDNEFTPVQGAAGAATFALLGVWTGSYLASAHLHAALALYFIFALVYSAAPVVLHRVRKTAPPWWCNAFPALALVLVLMPVLKLTELSILVWPLVFLVDVLAVILAVVTAALLPILIVLVLTLMATAAWISRIPSELTGLPTALFLLGGFAVFFIVAAVWACRKLAPKLAEAGTKTPSLFGDLSDLANLAVQIPALSATLPFLLLIMLTLRLPLANPSPVFGLALLLVVLILGLAKIMALDALPLVGLASIVALEHAWHFHHFNRDHAATPLAWYLIFYAVFTAFPFLFHRQFAKTSAPWAAAALAGPLHFYLLHQLVRAAYPSVSGVMGLLPATFSLPALLGVLALVKRTPAGSPARDSQLAWFGGSALFFITLIFPIQFERQWITIGWALEGAALCWLFHRVPHRGLRVVGVALFVVAFARLALNPEVLSYRARGAMPILNWYLYAYGITTVCHFTGARLLAPPRNRVLGIDAPPLLCTLGTILAFLLVNIEIADFFTTPGSQSLIFQFSGNFARDMSYSIAWAAFALAMLIIGIAKRLAPVRYASIGLLGVTLLKLFIHDLSQLDQLYRVGALIVVAVIAIFASFLYQRFLAAVEKDEVSPTPPPAG